MPELLLVVEKKWMETPTIPAIRLNLGGKPYPFKAGQYSLVSLNIGNEWEDHSFSMACAPNSEYVEFATRMSDSAYKKAFSSLEPGDEVKITGPFGQFTLDEKAQSMCFLSGGIGITPIRSMVQFACREKLGIKMALLFGNRNAGEIPFKKELDALQRKNKNLNVVHVVSEGGAGWTGLTGKIDAELVKKHSDTREDYYYVCGPPGMVGGLTSLLKQLNVEDNRIKIEHFSGYK